MLTCRGNSYDKRKGVQSSSHAQTCPEKYQNRLDRKGHDTSNLRSKYRYTNHNSLAFSLLLGKYPAQNSPYSAWYSKPRMLRVYQRLSRLIILYHLFIYLISIRNWKSRLLMSPVIYYISVGL